MILQIPYTAPKGFVIKLVEDYNMQVEQKWNCTYLRLPPELGSGGLQFFVKGGFHFFRGKWNFNQPTGFRALDKVGSNNLVDFRINQSKQFQSAYIQGLKRFEWDITQIDGFRVFIPKTFIEVDKYKMEKKFEKYLLSSEVCKLLDELMSINPNNTADELLIEAKFLEFTHYWIKFLNNTDLDYLFEGLNDYELAQLKLSQEILDNNLHNPPDILMLSKQVGLNTNKLKTGFRKIFGITIRQYIIKQRMEKARELIRNSDYPLSHICQIVGYHNRGHFAALYQKYFGCLPCKDRKSIS